MMATMASGQVLVKNEKINGMKFDKTAVMAADQFAKPAQVKHSRRAAADKMFGNRIATELGTDGETYQSFPLSMESCNVEEDGVVYNVKINDFWMEGTTLYGIFDEEAGTLTIPNQLIWSETSLEGLGYSDATKTYGPLEIVNINGEDKVTEDDLLLLYDADENTFSFDGDQTAAYYIYADGVTAENEEVGGWTYAYEVNILPYNGIMDFSTTATKFQTREPREGSSWGYGEMNINYQDWGSSVQINGFLGSGCISIGYGEDNTATMMMHQPLSTDKYPGDAGYMQLIGVVQNDDNTISFGPDVESISGEVFRDVTIDGVQADVIRFYGVDENNKYTYNEYFIPLTADQKYWMGGWFCALELVLYKDEVDLSGINDVKTATTAGKTFNLMGQQVEGAKGLLIRDGKKFIKK